MNSFQKINTKIKTWVILKKVMATVLAATLVLPSIKTYAMKNGSNKLQPDELGYLSSTESSRTQGLEKEDSSTSESFAQHHPLISGAMAGCGVVAVAGVIAAIKNAFSPPLSVFLINAASVMNFVTEHPDKINAVDEMRVTLLCRAVCAGNKELAEFLISKGADVNQLDLFNGWAPLHYAAFYGNTEMCELLLKNYAEVDIRNGINDTPLTIVCYSGQQSNPPISDQQRFAVAKLLLDCGANINAYNAYDDTPLTLAAGKFGCFDIMQLLVDTAKSKDLDLDDFISECDIDGFTPLMSAAAKGNVHEFEYLLKNGADTDAINISKGYDVLIIAAEAESYDVVKYILDHHDRMESLKKIDVNYQSYNTTKTTALHEAVCTGNLNIVKLLLEHNANPNLIDCYDVTPLDIANKHIESEKNSEDVAKYRKIAELLKAKGGKTGKELSNADDEDSDDDDSDTERGDEDGDDGK